MKLATRLTLAIGLFAVALFATGGALLLQRERRELETVERREALLLARSLQVAFENALRDRQIEDVSETLAALERVEPEVGIFVFDEEGKLVGASAGAVASVRTHDLELRARSNPQPLVEVTTHTLRVGMKLRDETPESPSAIVLEKPLTTLQADLARTQRFIALTVIAFVAAVALLAWVLTRRYVGAPLRQMVSDMRRVREGDLSVAQTTRTLDEVGETAHEFDELVKALATARTLAKEEGEARQRMERGLQDADKLITLGQLSAVMAHEIGSPLQVLEGRARALSKHAGDAEATTRTAQMLVEQTERITRIVGQMLSMTRRRAPAPTTLNGAQCVQTVVALLEVEARRREVTLQFTSSGDTTVFADADQLQQVALNLLRNAIAASPRNSTVSVRVAGDGERFVLEVQDEGPGLSAEVRKRLFEPFFTTRSHDGGTGLGLSVVHTIVRDHQGTVEFPEVSLGCLARVSLSMRSGESNCVHAVAETGGCHG
ncbi:MAG: sensor histidine kinase [Archangium sp.]